jgi:hypothetical protein
LGTSKEIGNEASRGPGGGGLGFGRSMRPWMFLLEKLFFVDSVAGSEVIRRRLESSVEEVDGEK